jgi:hypothetical protein
VAFSQSVVHFAGEEVIKKFVLNQEQGIGNSIRHNCSFELVDTPEYDGEFR